MGLWVVKYAEPFFFLPLGHPEKLTHLEVAVKLAEELVEQAPAELRRVPGAFRCASPWASRANCPLGRHSHRKAVLARQSTRRNSTTWPAANSYIRGRCRPTVVARLQAAPPGGAAEWRAGNDSSQLEEHRCWHHGSDTASRISNDASVNPCLKFVLPSHRC